MQGNETIKYHEPAYDAMSVIYLNTLRLTHFSRMEFPTDINWNSPYPILGLLGGIFHFYSEFDRTFCKQTVNNLIRRRRTPRSAASGLFMHCLANKEDKNVRKDIKKKK